MGSSLATRRSHCSAAVPRSRAVSLRGRHRPTPGAAGRANQVLAENGWTIPQLRDQRYEAVVHLQTAALGAAEHYTLANNAARMESPDEARKKTTTVASCVVQIRSRHHRAIKRCARRGDEYDVARAIRIRSLRPAYGNSEMRWERRGRRRPTDEAVALDARLSNAWVGHNALHIIDNRKGADFEDKMVRPPRACRAARREKGRMRTSGTRTAYP